MLASSPRKAGSTVGASVVEANSKRLERLRQQGSTPRFRPRNPRDNVADRDPRIAAAVVRAREGNREAIAFLYSRYCDSVYGYVLSIVKEPHEAEDVTQQVFLKLMTVLHQYEPRQVPFAAWIVRVARNAAYDHVRDKRQVPCEEVYGADERADDSRNDCRRALEQALETLPDEQRSVIVLRHLFGYTPGEIAAQLGKTAPSIHGLHHRGRHALRAELVRMESAPATR